MSHVVSAPEQSLADQDVAPETSRKTLTAKNFRCGACGKAFAQRSDLNRHAVVHSGLKNHVCDWCGRGFSLKTNLSAHTVVHTGVRTYKCGVCDREFHRRDDLKKHREVHAGEKIHKCEFCGKAFAKSSNLFRHMDIHSGVRNFSCDLCSKSFFQKTDLTRHMAAVHSGIKNFSCPTCGKEFSLKSNLTKHLPVHSGDKSHKCHVCNKGFFRKSSLASHLMIHIFPKSSAAAALADRDGGEGLSPPPGSSSSRSYNCDLCGKEFNRKSSLIRHHVVHSGERNFRCEICGKEFNRKSILERHMDVHADAKNVSCGICGKEFNQKSNMDRHMAVHFKPQMNNQEEQEDDGLVGGRRIAEIKRLLTQKILLDSRGERDGSEICGNEMPLAGVSLVTEVRQVVGEKTRETLPSPERERVGETLSLGNSLLLNIHRLLSRRVREIQSDENDETDALVAREIPQSQTYACQDLSRESGETAAYTRKGTGEMMTGSNDDGGVDLNRLLNQKLKELTSERGYHDDDEGRRLNSIRQLMLLRDEEDLPLPAGRLPSGEVPQHLEAGVGESSEPSKSDLESVMGRSAESLYSILAQEMERIRGSDSEYESS